MSINKEVYELIRQIPVKENGYIFSFGGFKQSEQLAELLESLGIEKQPSMVYVTHMHHSCLHKILILLMYRKG